MFWFIWFFIPETKGLSLEKMDDLFGVTELAKAVEAREVAEGDVREHEIPDEEKQPSATRVERV
jgi:hypothetical protein